MLQQNVSVSSNRCHHCNNTQEETEKLSATNKERCQPGWGQEILSQIQCWQQEFWSKCGGEILLIVPLQYCVSHYVKLKFIYDWLNWSWRRNSCHTRSVGPDNDCWTVFKVCPQLFRSHASHHQSIITMDCGNRILPSFLRWMQKKLYLKAIMISCSCSFIFC